MVELPRAAHTSSPEAEATAALHPGIERVPGWERYPWLRAGFSTRQGGGSQVYGPGEQNLGWTKEDNPATVACNRQSFLKAIAGGDGMPLISLHQVHGAAVLDAEAQAEPMMSAEGKALLRGDGLLSRRAGHLLGISTADCVPVLLADVRLRAVGAFHAGWRGTLARIVQRGAQAMRDRFGSRPEDLVAAIGPSIGTCCFAVGEEVRAGFALEFPYTDALLHEQRIRGDARDGDVQIFVDLSEANRRQLLEAGLGPESITTLRQCTACTRLADNSRKYFSYRGEQGITGRMLSVIGVTAG